MEQKKLSESWTELNEWIVNHPVVTPQDFMTVGSKLLEVLSLASNEKVRLVAFLKKNAPKAEDYAKNTIKMVVKGMAYEERKMMRELSLPKAVYDATRQIEVINEIVAGCSSYMNTLKLLNSAMNLEGKLSFAGHD